jgi:hypothetical protein
VRRHAAVGRRPWTSRGCRLAARRRRLPPPPPPAPPAPPRSAYNLPWGGSSLRYVDDGRPFWRRIVSLSVGSSDEALFEELYGYYSEAAAWKLAPGAVAALTRLRASGVKLAVCSNFDTRLRPVLRALGVDRLFDAIVVSAGATARAGAAARGLVAGTGCSTLQHPPPWVGVCAWPPYSSGRPLA